MKKFPVFLLSILLACATLISCNGKAVNKAAKTAIKELGEFFPKKKATGKELNELRQAKPKQQTKSIVEEEFQEKESGEFSQYLTNRATIHTAREARKEIERKDSIDAIRKRAARYAIEAGDIPQYQLYKRKHINNDTIRALVEEK
jgi:hypothetical protein